MAGRGGDIRAAWGARAGGCPARRPPPGLGAGPELAAGAVGALLPRGSSCQTPNTQSLSACLAGKSSPGSLTRFPQCPLLVWATSSCSPKTLQVLLTLVTGAEGLQGQPLGERRQHLPTRRPWSEEHAVAHWVSSGAGALELLGGLGGMAGGGTGCLGRSPGAQGL